MLFRSEAGWSLSAGDCDDGDAAVNPDAIEACNAADDDCDGTVDDVEDLAPWYDDLDGDGWGDATTATRTCEPAGGQVDVSGDCDDSDADISPDAVEVCGGADEDCDGDVDEDDAIDAESWYFDGDGDSWGDPASVRYACDQPVTWIARGADCDDTSDTVWPGADELCNRIDDDCDLDVDEPDAIDATTWYADTDEIGRAHV